MPTRTIFLVAGARPNFMKIAPIMREFAKHPDTFRARIVHTGQHYDSGMSGIFFKELGIPEPDYNLGVGSGSHAEQTARIMVAFEKTCISDRPDLVLVVGDVNSTLACAIVAKKLCIPVAHVEAGLRSGDMAMPEEINRIVTDSISDWFFVTEPSGMDNLRREGHAEDRLHFVGHVMIDNLYYQVEQLQHLDVGGFATDALKRQFGEYGVVTLHRPSNVDNAETLKDIMGALGKIAARLPLIFAVHPRTRGNLDKFGIPVPQGFHLTGPLPYMEFLNLWKDARMVLTDSGGIQEETTALGVPCITLRENTERPVTVTEGTNVIVGTDPARILAAANDVFDGRGKQGRRPELWDGHAAGRIVQALQG
jgi:UDP-N-acetylglucosamine 2-epimerase (non-hydrolysing)